MADKPLEPEQTDEGVRADVDPGAPAEQPTSESAPEASTTPSDGGGDTSALLEKLDALTAEANAHRDRALRATAELENYRRRAVREKEEVRRFANQNLLEDFLPLLDNFALGLEHARQHEAGKPFAEGFAMVLGQIENWLSSHGVERLNPAGEAFDPNLHEAIGHEPHAEVPEHHVLEVQRSGYRLHDRLLRPAAVVISSGPPADTESGES